MALKSKKRVATAQKAFADVALAAANLKAGESVSVERTFPGGHIHFACRRAALSVEITRPAKRNGVQAQ